MALIEDFRVQNYRSLRDVTLGQLEIPLIPLTAVIGKNGSGKSTLFDAFSFLADCLSIGVEAACNKEHRGGFERLRSQGVNEPISFEVRYREAHDSEPIYYELHIECDNTGHPGVYVEALGYGNLQPGTPNKGMFLYLERGSGRTCATAVPRIEPC
nr:AAA family ATPase [uncultured Rhodopila sp.]